jgi:hypothetical protein
MPSVIGLLEQREARAREELESWLEVLRQAQEEVTAAQERAERARVAREELVQALAEESAVSTVTSVPAGGDADASAASGASGAGVGYDERPPVWEPGLGEEALSGLYRKVFAAVAAAEHPVSGVQLARAVGRQADSKNEVEKMRHRAYTLEARGWLVREKGGLFTLAPRTAGAAASPAGAEHPRPAAATA